MVLEIGDQILKSVFAHFRRDKPNIGDLHSSLEDVSLKPDQGVERKLITDSAGVQREIIIPWLHLASAAGDQDYNLPSGENLVSGLIKRFQLPPVERFLPKYASAPRKNWWMLGGHNCSAEEANEIAEIGGLLGFKDTETLYDPNRLKELIDAKTAFGNIWHVYMAPVYVAAGYGASLPLRTFKPDITVDMMPQLYLRKHLNDSTIGGNVEKLIDHTSIVPNEYLVAKFNA